MTILENYVGSAGRSCLSLNYRSGRGHGSIDWLSRECDLIDGQYPDDVVEECRTTIDIMIDKLVEARRTLDTLGQIT